MRVSVFLLGVVIPVSWRPLPYACERRLSRIGVNPALGYPPFRPIPRVSKGCTRHGTVIRRPRPAPVQDLQAGRQWIRSRQRVVQVRPECLPARVLPVSVTDETSWLDGEQGSKYRPLWLRAATPSTIP